MINTVNINPEVRKQEWLNFWHNTVNKWPDTHTQSPNLCVRPENLVNQRLAVSSSTARIPPSRRGISPADIKVKESSCQDKLSSGRGSSADRRLELAIHKSGTAGREGRCSVAEAPRRPASKSCRGRLAGVRRREMTTGVSSSRVSLTSGKVTSGMSWGMDSNIIMPSSRRHEMKTPVLQWSGIISLCRPWRNHCMGKSEDPSPKCDHAYSPQIINIVLSLMLSGTQAICAVVTNHYECHKL